MKRAALVSVSDKTGLLPFAKALSELGFVLLATSGSRAFLSENGVSSESIEDYTGQKEILGGRVKTLHPKIHAGLLARRDNTEHMSQLEADGIYPIDVAVINLYPFLSYVHTDTAKDIAKMIELIDVGGPTMIRASAKNFHGVLPVLDPSDYASVIEELTRCNGEVVKCSLELKRQLSTKVFSCTANYDLAISRYLSSVSFADASEVKAGTVDASFDFAPIGGFVWERVQSLRYGENPHQKANFYRTLDGSFKQNFKQLQGKELSYNNLLDFDAALRMIQSFPSEHRGAVIVKHLNPCGAAFGATVNEAIVKAKKCDPRSHFGGIIAVNYILDEDAAAGIAGDFAEIVIAPDFTDGALTALSKSKNLRVLKTDIASQNRLEFRSVQGGVLVQESDLGSSSIKDAKLVSKRPPTKEELESLSFAWTLCSHVKSNTIVLAKDCLLVGVGAGQMSRIDSAEVAVMKAKTHNHDLNGAVAASDAFFPFPDTIEFLAAQGVKAIVAPSGAKRDQDAIDACDKLGISLLFVTDRHFRH